MAISHRLLSAFLPLPSSPSSSSSPSSAPVHLPLRWSSGRWPRSRFAVFASLNPDFSRVQEAVWDVLREAGASVEDASHIVETCPDYLDTLVNNVKEIDDHSLWSSLTARDEGHGTDSSLTFREKAYYMAKRKGDRGILPFLESVGLRDRSSSTRVAAYLASQPLPQLITKVNDIKEILLHSSGCEEQIGRNARRMMMLLSIPTDDSIQQTLSFFEKMEARRGGLDMLGHTDACLPCLIDSFPQILLCSLDNQLKPFFKFLETIGIPTSHIKSVILLFPPVLFYDVEEDIKPKMHYLLKLGIQDKDFCKVLLKYPWILSRSILENYEEIQTYFETEKVSKSYVDCAIKSWPHLLGCSTGKLKQMVQQLRNLGVRSKTLAMVVASSPQLLLRKQSDFFQVVGFLEELGFERDAIGQILRRCPEIFTSDIEKILREKVRLLTDFGISSRHLPRVIRKYPELLVSDVQNNLLPRMMYLMEMGLSKSEVRSMVCRFSPLLGYSIEKVLKPKLEFLIETMEKPLKEVVEYPRYFSYSLEKKIKPRYYVLKGRNMHSTSLKDMLCKNDEEFATDYMGLGRMLVPPYVNTSEPPR